jgi:DUF4097 and DUF4098 domain-containing protein YvlB
MLIAGGILFAIEMEKVDWDFTTLDNEVLVEENYSLTEAGLSLDDVEKISFNVSSTEVVLKKEGSDFTVKYYDSEYYSYEAYISDGTFNFVESTHYEFSLKNPFLNIKRSQVKTVLTIPEDYNRPLLLEAVNLLFTIDNIRHDGQISITSDSATVHVNNCNIGNLSVSLDNGAIRIINSDFTESLKIHTDNGAVKLNEVNAQSVEVNSGNGAITMDSVNAQASVAVNTNTGAVKISYGFSPQLSVVVDTGAISINAFDSDYISAKTQNGSIDIALQGDAADYKITALTQYGSISVPENALTADGPKIVYASSKNGSVKIRFK